jgi:hypothetical protein
MTNAFQVELHHADVVDLGQVVAATEFFDE